MLLCGPGRFQIVSQKKHIRRGQAVVEAAVQDRQIEESKGIRRAAERKQAASPFGGVANTRYCLEKRRQCLDPAAAAGGRWEDTDLGPSLIHRCITAGL